MRITTHSRRAAKQLYRWCVEGERFNEDRARQVAQYVSAAGHRDCPAILSHFLRLVRLDRQEHTARVESATPLAGDMQAAIRVDLTRRYGPGLATTFADRPALLGGMRIQVGCDVYDGSLLARLTLLENSL